MEPITILNHCRPMGASLLKRYSADWQFPVSEHFCLDEYRQRQSPRVRPGHGAFRLGRRPGRAEGRLTIGRKMSFTLRTSGCSSIIVGAEPLVRPWSATAPLV